MPNSVVKRSSADGSVGSPHVRVGHRQACFLVFRFLEKSEGKNAYLADCSMLLITMMLMYWHTLRVSLQNSLRIARNLIIKADMRKTLIRKYQALT
ncbi:hypothetical protein BZG13_12740 [Salinivibrio sp. ML323]|nr:hypothetical protein [Salinivibrio sp. ML323]OOE57035.1 hypothetical protein BZG13_12740 [Salinivibrio sp. ML323]